MRAVVQRVRECSVAVGGEQVSAIHKGLLVYLGVTHTDTANDVIYIADKVANLRVFPDVDGKMNLSLLDLDYDAMVVSQFTLFGDVRRGRRPSYDGAASPEYAAKLYEEVISQLSARGVTTQGGVFQAKMEVQYINEGPVTILIDSQKQF